MAIVGRRRARSEFSDIAISLMCGAMCGEVATSLINRSRCAGRQSSTARKRLKRLLATHALHTSDVAWRVDSSSMKSMIVSMSSTGKRKTAPDGILEILSALQTWPLTISHAYRADQWFLVTDLRFQSFQ